MLIIFAGLPGTGKTTIARELARQLRAVHLRIDSIEEALRDFGIQTIDDAGYRVAYAIAADNLLLGLSVIADSVNPLQLTRDAWIGVAARAEVRYAEVEIVCSDVVEHRRRIESRPSPWEDITSREYHAWNRPRLTIDTAACSVDDCVRQIRDRALVE